jgi:hypothetical protein
MSNFIRECQADRRRREPWNRGYDQNQHSPYAGQQKILSYKIRHRRLIIIYRLIPPNKKSPPGGGLYDQIRGCLSSLLCFLLGCFLLSCLLLGWHNFTSSRVSTFDGSNLQDVLGKVYDQPHFQAGRLQDAFQLGFIHFGELLAGENGHSHRILDHEVEDIFTGH